MLAAITVAGCGGDRTTPVASRPDARAAQRAVAYPLYWAGERVAGQPLAAILRTPGLVTFVYGSCRPQQVGEGGCAPPLEIQVASICDRNALLLDLRPSAVTTARGVPVMSYDGRVELTTGPSQVVLAGRPDLTRRALAALQPVGPGPAQGATLTPPRYPRYYLQQLRRVQAVMDRTGDIRAARRELGISKSAIRFELALARAIGAARLQAAGTVTPTLADRKAAMRGGPQRDCSLEP